MANKQYSKFQKAASNTAIKIKAYGNFLHVFGAGMQVVLQSMDVNKWWTIGMAMINLLGAALPSLAIIHEEPKSEHNPIKLPPEQSDQNEAL